MNQHKTPRKHGKFKELSQEAAYRKHQSLQEENGLGGYAPLLHDFSRRILPILVEYDSKNRDVIVLYNYILSKTNGDPENDRYMAAFPSNKTINAESGVPINRLAHISNILEACGMIKTIQDRSPNGRNQKLYYPQYYSDVPEYIIRIRMEELTKKNKDARQKANRNKDFEAIGKGEKEGYSYNSE